MRTNTLHQDEDRLSMNASAGMYNKNKNNVYNKNNNKSKTQVKRNSNNNNYKGNNNYYDLNNDLKLLIDNRLNTRIKILFH